MPVSESRLAFLYRIYVEGILTKILSSHIQINVDSAQKHSAHVYYKIQ